MEFVKGVSILISLFSRLMREFPFYKLYHNEISRNFMKAVEVRKAHLLTLSACARVTVLIVFVCVYLCVCVCVTYDSGGYAFIYLKKTQILQIGSFDSETAV